MRYERIRSPLSGGYGTRWQRRRMLRSIGVNSSRAHRGRISMRYFRLFRRESLPRATFCLPVQGSQRVSVFADSMTAPSGSLLQTAWATLNFRLLGRRSGGGVPAGEYVL